MGKKFGFSWGGGDAGKMEAPKYTPTERKGEMADLKAALGDSALQYDTIRKREVLKKVIAFMTLGVDTSSLFTDMILACATKDAIEKKIVYFYLCVQSEANSDLAILAINTLQKDCKDDSPIIRGLALRSLASLRLPQIVEYLVPTLKVCLVDRAPYVRKTAILATQRLYRVSPETFKAMNLTDKMYGMLRDNDSLVCTNALCVLTEVLVDEGGVVVNKAILYFLLNRLRDMSEWQQCHVLALVLKYTPANEDEMFDIMNLLEERLKGSNSAVILGCAHIFLHLTQNLPAVHTQVFERLKEPLLTLMATSHHFETTYAVLCHIKLLVQREPGVFKATHKDFFCRLNDPTFIKCIKMDILVSIGCDANAEEIVNELDEYVSDTNTALSKKAVDCMSKLALRVEGCSALVLERFLALLSMDVEHVRGQTLIAMKDFLRRYNGIETVRPFLTQIVESYKDLAFQDDESRIALTWVLGEFGEHIEEAPYLLESMSASFPTESAALRIEIMTAMMKLFFKRPPEVQPGLGKVFAVAVNDFSHADVHDRALLYYRLLRTNPRAASQVVCTPKGQVESFAEDDASDVRDKLFEEFNSMSVAFGAPSSVYVRAAVDDGDGDDEEEEDDDVQAGGLLSSDAVAPLKLDDEAEIEPKEFELNWARLPLHAQTSVKFKAVPPAEALESALEDHDVFVLATGQQGTLLKVFAYGKHATKDELYLVEMLIQATGAAQMTVKTDGAGAPFSKHFLTAISPFLAA
jgi:AP-4 complex subunit beta-1